MDDQLNAKLLKEKETFADAQHILDDFTKFLHNGGLDIVGANPYDRQQCYDKYESLEVMLKARQNELYHRPQRGFLLEDVELNLTMLNDIILNAMYFMVPNNETRRMMNLGKMGLLYARNPLVLYDSRYHNQTIPRWLKLLPQHLFESYDHVVTPLSNVSGIPSVRETYTTTSPQSKRQSILSEPKHEQNYTQPQPTPNSEKKTVQIPRKSDDRPKEYCYLSHRNRSAYYRKTTSGGKLECVDWFGFCGRGRRASNYS